MPLLLMAQTNLVPNPGFESYTSCPQFPPDGNINNAFLGFNLGLILIQLIFSMFVIQ
ncbi:MAG: hypothetical protein IPJ26_09890 [Bacteroidetes bacterium]|nr:hypothetical protein [Bacteroidota bacterium]